jgi:hypothetical protein
MIDKEKIPESTYKELIELFGIEDAEKIIIKNQYNFRAVSQIIIGEKFIRYFRLENFRIWLKKYTGLSMKSLLIILVIIGFVLYIFLPY